MEQQIEGAGLPAGGFRESADGAEAAVSGDPHREPEEPRPTTGEARVDAALARLDELSGRPVAEHGAVFEDLHRRLREVLGELDAGQPPQAQDATAQDARDAASGPDR